MSNPPHICTVNQPIHIPPPSSLSHTAFLPPPSLFSSSLSFQLSFISSRHTPCLFCCWLFFRFLFSKRTHPITINLSSSFYNPSHSNISILLQFSNQLYILLNGQNILSDHLTATFWQIRLRFLSTRSIRNSIVVCTLV